MALARRLGHRHRVHRGLPWRPAIIRRRFAAIGHHHRAAGYPVPADLAAAGSQVVRRGERSNPGQVEMLMRLLPSHGWTVGLFGRRDRGMLPARAASDGPGDQGCLSTVAIGVHPIGGVVRRLR